MAKPAQALRMGVLSALAMGGSVPCRGQEPAPSSVQVRFYDHNYGDFGGEFAANGGLLRCPYDPDEWVAGMVADTLTADSAKGKKIPAGGPGNACPQSLEKWFDPGESRLAVCGELPLRSVGTASRPVWSYGSDQFFPMDALGVEPNRGGAAPFHDFAFCMEINAGFIQRGGEVLKFRGDDDLWVYLDGRLVVDRGGIHFAKGDTVSVDSLPSSAGKLGKYRDLDVYFCSRVPSTSVFGMEVPLDPRPHPLKSLRITDTAGRELASRDVVLGKTKVCAGPVWEDGGSAACGNYRPPPAGFLSADWDLNGEALSGPGGSACVDLDPSGFPHGTKVQLTAKSGGKLARISLTLARAAKVNDGLLRGNGRAEWVEVPVDSGSGDLPGGLDVEFFFAGRDRYARAFPEGGGTRLTAVLGAGEAGPAGLTGFDPVEALTRQTHFGKTLTRTIRLGDGVAPILTGARILWAADGNAGNGTVTGPPGLGPAAWLEWEASEGLENAAILASDLEGTRKGKSRSGFAIFGLSGKDASPDLQLQALEPGRVRFRMPLSEASASAFRPGDSLSLSATVRDARGNPAGRFPVPILPALRLEAPMGGLRFAENPARGRSFIPQAGLPSLVLVSPSRQPLRDREPDRRVVEAGGPVLRLPVRAPLRRVEMRFHDHLGAAVNSAVLDFTDADWEAMRQGQAGPGDTTWVNLMWYPVSAGGDKLATGAYVVQGRAWTRDGELVRREDGDWAKVKAGSLRFGPTLFGYIRD